MAMSGGSGDGELNSEINVTPLVDVMLVLLIIFMITAPMMNTGVDIELPQVTAKNIEDPEGKLVLSIESTSGSTASGGNGSAEAFGSSTFTPCASSGAVTMKMISSTSMTSTSGVTLMSAIGV